MNPVAFLVMGLVVGIFNRADRLPDLGLGSWTVVWFAGALFYVVPVAMFVAPSWMVSAGMPIGCLLGIFLGYALARRTFDMLAAPWFR